MPMMPDVARIAELIREAVEAEVLPRFKKLAEGDISEKKPGDLVTTADIEAEVYLERLLMDALPGSLVIGEEAISRQDKTLAPLEEDRPVWVVDPVDGTANFAKGDSCFATMVALCRRGEVLAGWIHDPLSNKTAIAEVGSGAFYAGEPMRVGNPASLAEMTGPMWKKLEKTSQENARKGLGDVPRKIGHYGCVGHEYIHLADGHIDFAQYGLLQPWDHAAGVLLHREAGGFSALVNGERQYRAVQTTGNRLLLAPNEEAWRQLTRLFNS